MEISFRFVHDANAQIRRHAAIIFLTAFSIGPPPSMAQQGSQLDGTSATASSGETLQEVVVTAEKRQSTVQGTPISITAITGADLEARGLTNVLAVAEETPGISFRTAGPGQTEFDMRGVSSTGGSVGTTGFYLDETPIAPPSFGAIGKVVIDPNLYDLQSVEILRGPQGTLYGAGSMGGTVRLLTNQPNLHTFDASVDGAGSQTASGGGLNGSGDLMLNVPLSDGLAAVRFVASTLYQDGWLDRIVVNPFPQPSNTGCQPQPGFIGCARGDVTAGPYSQIFSRVNWERLNTFRPAVLIKPSDQLSITISSLWQETKTGGYDTIDIPPGCSSASPCGHYQPLDVPEPFNDVVRLISGVVRYETSIASVTSATSYWTRDERQTQDASEAVENILGPPFVGLPFSEEDYSKQFSEELRATSNNHGPFQWVAGLFYSRFQFGWSQYQANAAFAGPDNPQGQLYVAYVPMDTKQDAAFAEISYEITSAWKFTAGLRAFRYQIDANQTSSGIFTPNGNATPFQETVEAGDHGLNPKFNLAYVPNGNLTAYGTASKGFRPGGISEALPLSGPASCLPSLQALGISPAQAASYGPDSLWNYEIGEKARMLDGRLTVHSDVYYIRWSDIQYLIPISCGYILGQNAGQARSYGSELEIRAKVSNYVTLSLNGGYTSANINDPKFGLTPGQPLLNIPKYTASAAIDFQHAVLSDSTFTAHIAESVIGPQWDVAYYYEQLPSYALTNLRVGLGHKQWLATLFVENLTNKQAIQTINNTFFSFNSPDLTRATVNQPRTIGVKVQWQFR